MSARTTYVILRVKGPDVTPRRTYLGEVTLERAREIMQAMSVINLECVFAIERTTVERVS